MIALLVAAGVAAAAALIGTKILIGWLGARAVHQPILSTSEGGPGHEAKAGTPTMGGMAIVGAACVGYAVAHLRSGVIFTRTGLFVMLAMIGAGFVGFLDDWIKVRNARNLGLTKRTKMIGLLLVSIGFVAMYLLFTSGQTRLGFTRFDHPGLELGNLGWSVLAVFLILATTNAVNLTDGLDGLASGSAVLSFAAFVVIGFWAFRHPGVYALPHALDLSVVAAAMLGGCAGFLWWNAAPARIIMGDTGSLAIGAALACLALVNQHRAAPADRGRALRRRDALGDHPGRQLPHLSSPRVPHCTCASPLRAPRVAGDDNRRALLVAGRPVHRARARALLRGLHPHRGKRLMRALVYGMGVTGEAVADALEARGHEVVRADDQTRGEGVLVAPRDGALAAVLDSVDVIVPSPGVPEGHPATTEARRRGLPVVSELDLATDWDTARRPVIAITGTDGKTTVTTMVTDMLSASGRKALAVGNTDVPFVAALDADVDVFVVEASSFRLRWAERFAPKVATWLNIAPDHLDWHGSVGAYADAKARIFEHQSAGDVAIGNTDDPVVMHALSIAPARHLTFGASGGDYRVRGGELTTPRGEAVVGVADLPRALPHDVANALAAAATSLEAGATLDGVRAVLTSFRGLPHRVAFVVEADGIRWYDDSKATAPHATAAAVAGFEHVILIAGGRNKGLDLTALADTVDHVRAVVAIGESAPDVAAAFRLRVPVTEAASMDEAVAAARRAARAGDAVLLSPGCASFDWYRNYAERGDDFVRAVRELVGS